MEKKIIPNDLLLGEVSRLVAEGEKVTIMTKGVSMLPFIRGERDSVLLQRPENLAPGMIVLAYVENRRYVLHRIIKVRDNDYVIRGDNCLNREYGITDDDILGVLVAVIRNGREVSVESTGFKIYSRIWHFIFPVRFLYMKARRTGGKILRKLGLRK